MNKMSHPSLMLSHEGPCTSQQTPSFSSPHLLVCKTMAVAEGGFSP